MPNGHRDPYRILSGESPSPAHTSDSEETFHQKRRYHALARSVLRRWRLFVLRRRRQRCVAVLRYDKVLPAVMPDSVLENLALFLI